MKLTQDQSPRYISRAPPPPPTPPLGSKNGPHKSVWLWFFRFPKFLLLFCSHNLLNLLQLLFENYCNPVCLDQNKIRFNLGMDLGQSVPIPRERGALSGLCLGHFFSSRPSPGKVVVVKAIHKSSNSVSFSPKWGGGGGGVMGYEHR